MISIRKKYPTYKAYGKASVDELLNPKDRENALVFKATDMNSSYIENKGNGRFTISSLPAEAQFAPLYGLQVKDVDDDGNLDLLLTGNDYGMEPYSGRHDAFYGLFMKGNGKGKFSPMSIDSSGFFVQGDGKALATLHSADNSDLLIATQNQDSLLVFEQAAPSDKHKKWVTLAPGDFSATLLYKNGTRRKMEFYHGAGYLSQSSRKIAIDSNVLKMVIMSYTGNVREVK